MGSNNKRSHKKRKRKNTENEEEIIVVKRRKTPQAIRRSKLTAPLICLEKEVERLLGIRRLATAFQKITKGCLGGRWKQHFESWLWRRREFAVQNGMACDDILFSIPRHISGEPELIRKLSCSGFGDPDQCQRASDRLDAEMNKLFHAVHHELVPTRRLRVTMTSESKDFCSLACQDADSQDVLVCLQISKEMMESKLSHRWAVATGQEECHKTMFLECVFALLARYSSLQGGQETGAGGNQCAIPTQLVEFLEREFDVQAECFASPFNCSSPVFCSKFPEIEKYFGSCGEFFSMPFQEGSFEANPPFNPSLVERMLLKMEQDLASAELNQRALQFILILPCWQGSKQEGAKAVSDLARASKYVSKHLLIPKGKHGYHFGTQQTRPSMFELRASSEDTDVFILQNRLARLRWPVSRSKMKAFLHHFACK